MRGRKAKAVAGGHGGAGNAGEAGIPMQKNRPSDADKTELRMQEKLLSS
jgi:hypothetical protein